MSKRKSGASPKKVSPWKAARQAIRRKAAEARQARYDKLSIEQKIARLDDLGLRAIKERAKLQALKSGGAK